MSAIIVEIDGLEYRLYKKSIGVEGMANVFWFQRPVTIEDAEQLHQLRALGRSDAIKEQQQKLRELAGL